MAASNATLLAKISALEKRVNDLAKQLKDDETKLGALLGMSSGQLIALSTFSANVLNDMSAIFDAQWVALAGIPGATLNFLGGLSKLQHQTTSNSTISTGAGSLSAGDRASINGLVNAVNTLQDHLQQKGFEA